MSDKLTPIRKFTAIKLDEKTVNDDVVPVLKFGEITYENYYKERPETEFDTEEEAEQYAFKTSSYSTWLILPILKFENL